MGKTGLGEIHGRFNPTSPSNTVLPVGQGFLFVARADRAARGPPCRLRRSCPPRRASSGNRRRSSGHAPVADTVAEPLSKRRQATPGRCVVGLVLPSTSCGSRCGRCACTHATYEAAPQTVGNPRHGDHRRGDLLEDLAAAVLGGSPVRGHAEAPGDDHNPTTRISAVDPCSEDPEERDVHLSSLGDPAFLPGCVRGPSAFGRRTPPSASEVA